MTRLPLAVESLEQVLVSIIDTLATSSNKQVSHHHAAFEALPSVLKNVATQLTAPAHSTSFIMELMAFTLRRMMFHLVHHPHELLMRRLFAVLDVSLWCADHDYAEPTLPLTLIEEVLDVMTLDDAESVFDFIESRFPLLTQNMEPNRGKGLVLLRLCNELLRRVSKAKNTVFCGRVLMLLSDAFPCTERSGVNMKGEFHTENQTAFDTQDEESRSFYSSFWSIQTYLIHPTTLFQANSFSVFQTSVNEIIDRFTLLNEHDNSKSQVKLKKSMLAEESKKHYFFPKYLSGLSLFELELQDPLFRRQILVQLLIAIQFLFTLTQKGAIEPKEGAVANKAVQFSIVLTPEQETWVETTNSRLVKLLEGIHPGGRAFSLTLSNVLQHDKNWAKWKSESCFSFEKSAVQVEADLKKMRMPLSLAVSKPGRQPWLGCPELTHLWEKVPNIYDAIKEKAEHIKSVVKPLGDLLVDLDEQINPDGTVAEGIEEEYLYSKDPTFNWMAYRTATVHYSQLFYAMAGGISTITLLQHYRKDKLKGTDKESSPPSAVPGALTQPNHSDMQVDPPVNENQADATDVHVDCEDGMQDEALETKEEIKEEVNQVEPQEMVQNADQQDPAQPEQEQPMDSIKECEEQEESKEQPEQEQSMDSIKEEKEEQEESKEQHSVESIVGSIVDQVVGMSCEMDPIEATQSASPDMSRMDNVEQESNKDETTSDSSKKRAMETAESPREEVKKMKLQPDA